MKKHTFTVTLTFDGKITSDEDIKTLAQNIAESLKHTADTVGLAPVESETCTYKIEVENEFLPEARTGFEITKGTWSKF
jgi:hypothetical protein